MIGPLLSSGGFLGVSLSLWNFKVSPAYYFGDFGKDIPYFWSSNVRFDFFEIYLDIRNRDTEFKLGRFLPLDTGNIGLNSYSKGLDGVCIKHRVGGVELYYALFNGRSWVSDSIYYFNPGGRNILPGEIITRYILLRSFGYEFFRFHEIVIWSGTESSFPDMSFLNPLLPGYLYQWFKGREVNVLWLLDLSFKHLRFQLLIDDIQYLPSWWDTVPHKFGLRVYSSIHGFETDLLWIPAFVYGNRKVWDANYEAPLYHSDYAHASFKMNFSDFFVGVGMFGMGKYNRVFKEPNIGEYPKFSFLHEPVEFDGWLEVGYRIKNFGFSLGYGRKPFSIGYKRFFLWMYYSGL